jgi:hypothetical protein
VASSPGEKCSVPCLGQGLGFSCRLTIPLRGAVLCRNGAKPLHAACAWWVKLASSMISVCTSSEHCSNPVSLVNSQVVELQTGLASEGTFFDTADIVAR